MAVDTQTFTVAGAHNWVSPVPIANVTSIRIKGTGAGASAGTGNAYRAVGLSGGNGGGSGGGGGGFFDVTISGAQLAAILATMPLVIGAGGAAVPAVTASGGIFTQFGNHGNDGGDTTFGSLPMLIAGGGKQGHSGNGTPTGGLGGTNFISGVTSTTSNVAGRKGADAGAFNANGGDFVPPTVSEGGGGAAGGSGAVSGGSAFGTNGGNNLPTFLGGAGITESTTPAGNGTGHSTAGGGSAANALAAGTLTAGNGTDGFNPGDGSGGGGTACANHNLTSCTGGASGKGADGLLIVITTYTPVMASLSGLIPLQIYPVLFMVNHARPISLTGRYKS